MSSQFRLWLCICLGNLCKDNALVQSELFKAGIHFRLLSRLNDDAPDVRAASCYALACLIGSAARSDERCRTYSSDATTTAPTTCTSIATTDRRNYFVNGQSVMLYSKRGCNLNLVEEVYLECPTLAQDNH